MALFRVTHPAVAASLVACGILSGSRVQAGLDLNASAVEEPLEFFSVVYSGSSSGCGGAADPGTTATPIACLPDPYALICKSQDRVVRARAERLETRMLPYERRKRAVYDQAFRDARAALGPSPTGTLDEASYRLRLLTRAIVLSAPGIKRLRTEISGDLEASRARVKASVESAVTVFERMISRLRGGFTDDQRRQMLELLTCVKGADPDAGVTRWNASMATQMDPVGLAERLERLHEEGVDIQLTSRVRSRGETDDSGDFRVNPLLAARPSCSLALSAKAWLDCDEGNPSCFRVLFHELGHALNSCNFRATAVAARAELEKTSSSEEAKEATLRFIARQNEGLARTIEDNTSCLAALSDPKEAVLNTCERSEGLPRPFLERCNYFSAYDYPAQWDEAEADFFGASALAVWLEDRVRFPTPFDRAQAVYELTAQACADEEIESRRVDPLLGALKDAFGEELGGGGSSSSSSAGILVAGSCLAIPAVVQAAPGWNDSHQETATRFNRNYFRNADLRGALGCQLSADVPMSCSPRGLVRSVLPPARVR